MLVSVPHRRFPACAKWTASRSFLISLHNEPVRSPYGTDHSPKTSPTPERLRDSFRRRLRSAATEIGVEASARIVILMACVHLAVDWLIEKSGSLQGPAIPATPRATLRRLLRFRLRTVHLHRTVLGEASHR